jgi:hypothetical protein
MMDTGWRVHPGKAEVSIMGTKGETDPIFAITEILRKIQTPKELRKMCSWNIFILIMRIWKKSNF